MRDLILLKMAKTVKPYSLNAQNPDRCIIKCVLYEIGGPPTQAATYIGRISVERKKRPPKSQT